MCGLVGIVGKDLTKKDREIFSRLFLTNSLRGVDGCGLIALSKQKKKGKEERYYSIRKSEDPSSFYVYTKEYDDVINDTGVYSLLGHSRAATVGDVTVKNCHPFSFRKKDSKSRLVVMHNGTVRGKFPKSEDYEVDSEAMAALMAEVGIKKALEEVYKKAWNFAFALSIYDTDGTISLIRNKDRPLFLAKSGTKYMWASEKSFIEFATESLGDNSWTIESIPIGSLVKIFPHKEDPKERLKIIPNYYNVSRIIRSWSSSYTSSSIYGGYNGYSQQQGKLLGNNWGKNQDVSKHATGNTTFGETIINKTLEDATKAIKEVIKKSGQVTYAAYEDMGFYPSNFGLYVPWVPDDKVILFDIDGRLMVAREFERDLLANGCSFCDGYHDKHDEIRYKFNLSKIIPLCKSCAHSLNTSEYSWGHLNKAQPFYRTKEGSKKVDLTMMPTTDWYEALEQEN